METQSTDLERRIARAERQVRGLWFTILVLLGVGTILAKYQEPRAFRAPFQVLDSGGRVLMRVDDAKGKGAQLWLLPRQNKADAVLYSSDVGVGLDLFDRVGKPLASLSAGRRLRGLSLYDNSGKPVAALGAASAGGALSILRSTGDPAAVLGVRDGSGSLELYDQTGKPLFARP